MEGILLLILFAVLNMVAKQKKAKRPAKKPVQWQSAPAAKITAVPPAKIVPLKAAPPAAVQHAQKKAEQAPAPVEQTQTPERDGSIIMPPIEPHEHEGKPLPCPAQEREKPRPRPCELAREEENARKSKPAPLFTPNAMVQAVVMSEILNRPRFENGRRVIR